MADARFFTSATPQTLQRVALASDVFQPVATLPELSDRIPIDRIPFPRPPQPAPPTPAPPAQTPAPVPVIQPVPPAPVESPFDKLPFPSPGDRIKADDFKALSQSLKLLYDLVVLSSTLFGQSYGDARLMLASRGYQIGRVITVFGNEITNLADTALDARKVLQVIPAAPGHPAVMLVLSEGVDTRRFMPNLVNMNYRSAQAYIQSLLGDVTFQGAPPAAPQLVGLALSDAINTVPK